MIRYYEYYTYFILRIFYRYKIEKRQLSTTDWMVETQPCKLRDTSIPGININIQQEQEVQMARK